MEELQPLCPAGASLHHHRPLGVARTCYTCEKSLIINQKERAAKRQTRELTYVISVLEKVVCVGIDC